ncbi:hypothetical protein [Gramella sp. MAR_2010_147]|uniref:hypothetical protein n=1 Tax=Gramella sp. MAR_2010_147 TaxID=1250205 RepID=UPI00087C022D|nr:hypothetical protein [Gramella sp. MAR_2010_147]SDR71525.1 hypothetical protein SAMN04488553_0411 [Gramella sp. MAR_2010_147]
MIDNLSFSNIDWLLPVCISAILIWVIFIWKEWYVSKKKRFFLKTFLAFLAIGSLALIALKPVKIVDAEKNKVIIFTPGYKEAQLDSLQNETKKLEVINYEPGKPLFTEDDRITSAFILGHGIASFDLWQFDGISSRFLSAAGPDGVTKLHYKGINSIGDSFVLQGNYKNSKNGNRLILEGPAGRSLDSISFDNPGVHSFNLKSALKAKGNFLYSLVEKDSTGNLLTSNPVPVKVKDRQVLKILILNAYPTFETKYLKNFLAESGHEVVVRSQLTRGRFKFEYFNTERVTVNSISEEILENFDLLIIDAIELRNMAGRARDNLKIAVKEQGLGIFIQPDLNFFNSPGKFSELNFASTQNSEFRMEEWPKVPIETYAFAINDEFMLQAIHESDGHIISGYRKVQNGRIGTSVFQDTYKLILEGNTEAYQALWSQIITDLSKTEEPDMDWSSNSFMAYANEPFSFKIRTSIQDPEIMDDQENEIPIKADIDIPTLWTGTNFPREEGWRYLFTSRDRISKFYYYTGNTKDWTSLRAQKTMQENKRYFNSELKDNQLQKIQEPINLIWFYIVFLLSIGFLWLEPKISS